MGLYSNYPFALAAGLGLNAVAAFQLRVGMKLEWPAVMGIFVWEGVIITILVLTGLRQAISDAHSDGTEARHRGGHRSVHHLHRLEPRRVHQARPGPSDPVALGDLGTWPVLVAVVALLLTCVLHAQGDRALLIGILAATIVAIVVNYATGLEGVHDAWSSGAAFAGADVPRTSRSSASSTCSAPGKSLGSGPRWRSSRSCSLTSSTRSAR